ncbi:MAG: nucleotidyltransferase domain-containing protein [Crenarchaeota archaeon]|nr:nucleotidyltransferase domain-containing protein [Thermoproteota archaeon]
MEYRLVEFLRKIKTRFEIKRALIFGSFARRELHEGSDIDIIIIGCFKGRMHERILEVLRETDLPIEPLCYTESEFQKMLENKNPLLMDALQKGYWIEV